MNDPVKIIERLCSVCTGDGTRYDPDAKGENGMWGASIPCPNCKGSGWQVTQRERWVPRSEMNG